MRESNGTKRAPFVTTRRATLLVLASAACFSTPQSNRSSASDGGCGANFAGGFAGLLAPVFRPFVQGTWRTVCLPPSADAGSDADGAWPITLVDGGIEVSSAEAFDKDCLAGNTVLLGEPSVAVAVGAPFELEFDPPDGGPPPAVTPQDGGVAVIPTPEGWVVPSPQQVIFVARQGSEVVGALVVEAMNVDAIELVAGCIPPHAFVSGNTPSCELAAGGSMTVIAFPKGDQTFLGGAMACSFVTSDPSVLEVDGRGIVAHATAMAAGDALLAVSCLGVSSVMPVHVDLSDGGLDGEATDVTSADATGD